MKKFLYNAQVIIPEEDHPTKISGQQDPRDCLAYLKAHPYTTDVRFIQLDKARRFLGALLLREGWADAEGSLQDLRLKAKRDDFAIESIYYKWSSFAPGHGGRFSASLLGTGDWIPVDTWSMGTLRLTN